MAAPTAEEVRAIAYRASAQRRAASERARADLLRGSAGAALGLQERTRALMRRDRWGVPLQGCEEGDSDGREQEQEGSGDCA